MRAFLDTTVPVYATGARHDQRQPSLDVMEAAATRLTGFVTSSEVLQEILHLGVSRDELVRAQGVISRLIRVLGDRIVAVEAVDVLLAATEPFHSRLSSRDRVHVAVMRRLGVDTIISADHGFDLVPGIRRLNPLEFATWRVEVFG